jgi:hypothetical protein
MRLFLVIAVAASLIAGPVFPQGTNEEQSMEARPDEATDQADVEGGSVPPTGA